MRYTHKLKKPEGNCNYFLIPDRKQCDAAENKLGQLEDIEEELGIDLITLFKALTEDVYIKQGRKIIKVETPPVLLNFDGEYRFEWHYEKLENSFEQLSISQYGKTWALTKEELEK